MSGKASTILNSKSFVEFSCQKGPVLFAASTPGGIKLNAQREIPYPWRHVYYSLCTCMSQKILIFSGGTPVKRHSKAVEQK